MASTCRGAVWAVMLLLATERSGLSQTTTGTIVGIIHDQTGGVLPGVRVVITGVDTGLTREVVTNAAGQYAANLPIGNYEISFVLPRFQPFTARGLALHVNDRLQVNGKLMVGAVETLTVTAERLWRCRGAVEGVDSAARIERCRGRKAAHSDSGIQDVVEVKDWRPPRQEARK